MKILIVLSLGKFFSTPLKIVQICDHGTDLRGLKWFLTKDVRKIWLSRDLICIRCTTLTLSSLCHLVRRLTKLTNSDRIWLECVKIVKRRSKMIHMIRFLVLKCKFSRSNAYQTRWKSYLSNLFCQNSFESRIMICICDKGFYFIKKGSKSKFIFYSCWITFSPFKHSYDTPSRSDGLFSWLGFMSGLNNNRMPKFCQIWFTCKRDV